MKKKTDERLLDRSGSRREPSHRVYQSDSHFAYLIENVETGEVRVVDAIAFANLLGGWR